MEGVMNNKSPKSLQLDDDSDDEDDEFAGLGDDSEDDDGDEPEQTPPNFRVPVRVRGGGRERFGNQVRSIHWSPYDPRWAW